MLISQQYSYPPSQRLVRSWLFCIQHCPCLVSFGACLELVWRFKWRTFYISSWRVNLVWGCQEVLTWVWPSMNQNRLLFMQIQTPPLSMHHKWNFFLICMQINQWKIIGDQLPSKTPIELKDNSNIRNRFRISKHCNMTNQKIIKKHICSNNN